MLVSHDSVLSATLMMHSAPKSKFVPTGTLRGNQAANELRNAADPTKRSSNGACESSGPAFNTHMERANLRLSLIVGVWYPSAFP